MISKDTIGNTAIRIFRLYDDKSLTKRELIQKTRELLLTFETEKLQEKNDRIKRLSIDSSELQTIKKILKR